METERYEMPSIAEQANSVVELIHRLLDYYRILDENAGEKIPSKEATLEGIKVQLSNLETLPFKDSEEIGQVIKQVEFIKNNESFPQEARELAKNTWNTLMLKAIPLTEMPKPTIQ